MSGRRHERRETRRPCAIGPGASEHAARRGPRAVARGPRTLDRRKLRRQPRPSRAAAGDAARGAGGGGARVVAVGNRVSASVRNRARRAAEAAAGSGRGRAPDEPAGDRLVLGQHVGRYRGPRSAGRRRHGPRLSCARRQPRPRGRDQGPGRRVSRRLAEPAALRARSARPRHAQPSEHRRDLRPRAA